MKTVLQKLVLLLVLLPITVMAQWTQIGQTINSQHDATSSPSPTLFGESVALSTDGAVMAVGAPTNNNGEEGIAYVQVFRLVSGQWMQIGDDIEGTTYVPGLTRTATGNSIGLSADGNVLAIGEPDFQEMEGEDLISGGRVRVFQNINDQWIQIGDDIFETDNPPFGESISLSSDGNSVAIFATLASPEDQLYAGLVKVFKNISGAWVQIGDSIIGENFFGGRGSLLNIDVTGTKLVMMEFDMMAGQFEIETHKYENSEWIQTSSLLTYESISSLSLSEDSNKLAVGLSYEGQNGSGIARIYNWVNDSWVEEATLTPQVPINNGEFGNSISMSKDGTVVAVGSTQQAAYVFQNTENGWEQVGEYFDISERIAPALSADGSIFAMGLPRTNDFYGSVMVYQNCMLSGESADAPQAEAVQGFIDGDMLSDLTVTAEGSLTWYADEALTTILEDTTALVDQTTYYVTQTLNGCISEAIAITVDSSLSISNYEKDSFKYYPNPFKNNITFKAGSETIQSIQFYDITGKLVLEQTSNNQEVYQIDVSALSQAMYMVKVRTANTVKMIKLIKE